MPQHRLGAEDALFFDHRAPTRDGCVTFVFFNALTGDGSSWEARVAPALRAEGHGTLVWNYRGQTDSPFSPDLTVTAKQIVGDATGLLRRASARESDSDERRRIAEAVQERAYEIVVHLPLGQYVEAVAYRTDISGVLDAPVQLFWNIRKGE